MVASSAVATLSEDGSAQVVEKALAVWAVMETLDDVPATPEAQQIYERARELLHERMSEVGLDPEDVRPIIEKSRKGKAAVGHRKPEV